MTIASEITAPPKPQLPQPPATQQERRTVFFTAGVWLIFLIWTIVGLVESTAPAPVQIASWAALIVFPVVYLRGFFFPEPFPQVNRHLNTLAYSVALFGLGGIMSLSSSTAVLNVVPYVMAQWIFNHRLLTGVLAVAVLFGGAAGLVTVMGFSAYAGWFLGSVGSPAIIMIFIRISIEMGDAQLHRSEQLALAKQREELASTVHDVLGHSLTTITVKVQLAQRLLDTDMNAAKTELADIENLARRSLSEVRATVTELQHPDLAEQLNQAKTALSAAGVSFDRPEQLPRLTLVQQQVFAWVVREAVTNIIRHAHATAATITITQEEATMILRIDDNGIGLSETTFDKHHGLAGLRRRAASAGGRLDVHRLDPGTRVEVTL
ncbi:hypothetical protein GCM10009720_27730 [Yaniella flava]|uniref:Uncharacterized protein n=2 Tax=Yaniella flava TaxID=287930 RepID=A0ABP5GH73_9MICC